MLLSDGSVTRHLQLLTDLPVQVVRSHDLQLALKADMFMESHANCPTLFEQLHMH